MTNADTTTLVSDARAAEPADEEVDQRDKLQIEMEQLWVALDKVMSDIGYLRAQIDTESSDTESLFLRLTQRQMDMIDRFTDLTNNVVKQQAADLDTDAEIAKLRKMMLPIGPRARRNIDEHTSSLSKDSVKYKSLTNESVLKLGEINYYSDIAYQAMSTHNLNLLKLDFNNDETQRYLKESLYTRAETLAGQIQIAVQQRDRSEANLSADKENADLKANLRLVQK
ncbi:MAG: hypothetical protein ACI9YR_001752, partial [Bacteroidia bacterium]